MYDDAIFTELFDIFRMGIQFGITLGLVAFMISFGFSIAFKLFKDIAK